MDILVKKLSNPVLVVSLQEDKKNVNLKTKSGNNCQNRRANSSRILLRNYKLPHLPKPTAWDFTQSNKNSNDIFLTGVEKENDCQNLFVIQDFSKYHKKPEQYLPKNEINKIFLEKISSNYQEPKKNIIRPKSSAIIPRKTFKSSCSKPAKKFGLVNQFSHCDPEYLKAKSTHINKLKRVQQEYYRLRKNQPLKIVPGYFEAKKIIISDYIYDFDSNVRSVSSQTKSN